MTKSKWPMVKLGDVCDINPRIRKKPSSKELVSFVPMDHVSPEGFLLKSESRAFEEVSKGYTLFEKNSVLVAKITPCFENNKTAVAKIESNVGAGSTEFHVFRPKPGLDVEFLHFFLRRNSIFREGSKCMTGSSGHRRVPAWFFKNLSIPLPPLEEQKRIAGILQKATNEDSAVQKQIELLSEVTLQEVRALLKKWEMEENIAKKPLVAFGKFQGGLTPSKSNALFWNGNIPWFSTKDLDGTHHKADSLDHVSDEAISQTSLRRTEQAGIAFSVRGMSLAHRLPMAVIPSGSTINQDLKVFLPKEPNKCESLYWLVKAKEQELLSHVSSSAHGTRKLDFNYLQQVHLPDLSKDQHSQISNVVVKIQQLQKCLRKKEGLISELTESLSSRAFRGRL